MDVCSCAPLSEKQDVITTVYFISISSVPPWRHSLYGIRSFAIVVWRTSTFVNLKNEWCVVLVTCSMSAGHYVHMWLLHETEKMDFTLKMMNHPALLRQLSSKVNDESSCQNNLFFFFKSAVNRIIDLWMQVIAPFLFFHFTYKYNNMLSFRLACRSDTDSSQQSQSLTNLKPNSQ